MQNYQVFRFGREATLRRDEVLTIVSQIDNTASSTIFQNIFGLLSERKEIAIIGNLQLNSQLVGLANRMKKIEQLLQKN